jgi:sugar transferase (PEP-CTERM/EpsH1 system associated)
MHMSLRPRKVLHILHAFSHGGLENGIVNIINGSSPDLEHELCLLTTAGEFIHRLKKPVRYYELRKQPGNSLKTILNLRRVIRESGANIVHTRNWGAFDGVMAACLCPGITVLHGEHGRDITDPQGLNRRRNLLRRLFSPRIRKFTTVSEDLAEWLRQEIRIPKSKIVLIHNGVDTKGYHPHRDPELRKELGIREEEFVIGTIGRLDPVKNHAGLIRAFNLLANEISDLRLVIVGDGTERPNLEALIRALDLGPVPILTGYRSDIERFYGIFDAFVLNSFAEGMSNTLLEAMSSGLAVVCTPVGANVDLIEDNVQGRFVATGDDVRLAEMLREYKNSQDLRIRLGIAARSFVEESYSLSKMVSNYNDLYLSL